MSSFLDSPVIRTLRSWLVAPEWLEEVDADTLRLDLIAGLSVGVMLVPQAMAYATLAGLPAILGLYASLVPLLVYPFFGSSRQLAVGVVALDMLIIGAGLARVAEPGTDRFVALAILLAAVVGLVQIAMSALRMGMLADLLSRPVITGFTAAAALVIAASQIGPLVGLDLPRSEFVHEIVGAAWASGFDIHPATALLGLGSVAVIYLLRYFLPRAPGALVVVALGIALVSILGLESGGVEVTGEIPGGLPGLQTPGLLSGADVMAVLPTAFTLALIQLMSGISIGRALSTRHSYTVRPNRELLGLGFANLAGSFFRGIPISASFSRSALNEHSGAQTPLANVFAAGLVALSLLFLTPLFELLPQASLAAIIVVSALGLVRPKDFVHLVGTHRRDGILALITAAATLGLGIQEGVIVGVVASTLMVLYRFSRPNISELGIVSGTQIYRDRDRFDQAESIGGILVLRVDAAFSFFNAAFFRDRVLEKTREEPSEPIRAVVLEARGINDLDTTALDTLRELVGTLRSMGVDLYLAGLKGRVRDILERSDIGDDLADDCFHLSSHHAVRHVLERWDRENHTDRLERYDEWSGGDEEGAPSTDVPLT